MTMKRPTVKEFPIFHRFEDSSDEVLINPNKSILTSHKFKNGIHVLISNIPYSDELEDSIISKIRESKPKGTSVVVQENTEHTRFAIGLLNFEM